MNADINSLAIPSTRSTTTPLDDLAFPFDLRMIASKRRRHNPRKKRSRIGNESSAAVVASKAKFSKKPDPAAPKTTPPCTECGKKFWSVKALSGHMRCHPERQWRGINPPVNFRRPVSVDLEESETTEEDQNIAACLILLANGPNSIDRVSDCRFECSSCKKVFGSHQALGGHRASHKNVKGCFAMAKSDDEETEDDSLIGDFGRERSIDLEDKMSIVFTAGGHKRCHWERVEENAATEDEEDCVDLDMNMPAPVEDGSSSSYSSGLTLDLRLGL